MKLLASTPAWRSGCDIFRYLLPLEDFLPVVFLDEEVVLVSQAFQIHLCTRARQDR